MVIQKYVLSCFSDFLIKIISQFFLRNKHKCFFHMFHIHTCLFIKKRPRFSLDIGKMAKIIDYEAYQIRQWKKCDGNNVIIGITTNIFSYFLVDGDNLINNWRLHNAGDNIPLILVFLISTSVIHNVGNKRKIVAVLFR
jgi:hypothetical protein